MAASSSEPAESSRRMGLSCAALRAWRPTRASYNSCASVRVVYCVGEMRARMLVQGFASVGELALVRMICAK
eukprot:7695567-Alexandrium_andersonii.AAC.1